MEAGNFAAAGGVSGAIIAVGYAIYKICYRKKFHSKCCGAELDMSQGPPSPSKDVQLEMPTEPRPTPKASPALHPAEEPALAIPKLEV